MDETMMNAEGQIAEQSAETVVQSQEDGAQTGEVATPRDIESMSDDEFAEYLEQVQSGNTPPGRMGEQRSESGVTGPDVNDITDEGNGGDEPTDTGDTDPQKEEAKPYKVYKTHEEFQQDFDRVMGERLKKNRESIDLLDKLKIEARNFYGDAADDAEAVNRLLGDLANQNAEKRGVETAEYNRQTQDAQDARRWREEQEAKKTQKTEVDAIREKWAAESEDLRRIVPAFDFDKAIKNAAFKDAILKGASVQTAYMIANQPKEKPKRQPIKQVAMQSGVSGKTDFDPSKLPKEDFDAYIEGIMNG